MKKITFVISATVIAAGVFLGSHFVSDARAQDAAASERVYELRTYHANEGKLEALHARFRDHTSYLFVKHGMTLIGYWTPTDEKDGAGGKLIYLIAHDSRDAAKASWSAFGSDPAWQAVYKEATKDGRLVGKIDSVYMSATDYSPLR